MFSAVSGRIILLITSIALNFSLITFQGSILTCIRFWIMIRILPFFSLSLPLELTFTWHLNLPSGITRYDGASVVGQGVRKVHPPSSLSLAPVKLNLSGCLRLQTVERRQTEGCRLAAMLRSWWRQPSDGGSRAEESAKQEKKKGIELAKFWTELAE